MLTLDQVLTLAKIHNRNTSSRLRLFDAFALREKGLPEDARRAAIASLRHSVGVLHPDFKRATIVL